jgi:hypothetical protein
VLGFVQFLVSQQAMHLDSSLLRREGFSPKQ